MRLINLNVFDQRTGKETDLRYFQPAVAVRYNMDSEKTSLTTKKIFLQKALKELVKRSIQHLDTEQT